VLYAHSYLTIITSSSLSKHCKKFLYFR